MKWILPLAAIGVIIILCSGDFKRYGGKDILEEWYYDQVDKNPDLKQMEKDISSTERWTNELQAKFNSYDNVSNEYYQSATSRANMIKDSSLSSSIRRMISANRERYNASTAALREVLRQINKKELSMSDYHLALQIVKTLPTAEKYQRDNLPAAAEYNDLIRKLDETIGKMQTMVK